MICEDCGEEKDDVEECSCPKAWEYGEDIKAFLCKDCYGERCMDR
jgi:hypothetical protein